VHFAEDSLRFICGVRHRRAIAHINLDSMHPLAIRKTRECIVEMILPQVSDDNLHAGIGECPRNA